MDYKALIDAHKIPKHVAIIMDGNGRWAKQRNFAERLSGHKYGVKAVRSAVEAAIELGVQYITLYAFSTENWSRPEAEVFGLMELMVSTLQKEVPELNEQGVRLNAIGDLNKLPKTSYDELMRSIDYTKNNQKLTLTLALSYSSRWEITKAVQEIALKVAEGKLSPDQIDQALVGSYLVTNNLPDPELLIRTSGELRISNYLLWQIAYAELYFTNTLWPDFNKEEFYKAILDYQKRERRFGKTSEQIVP